jgi:gas vesicle protein
MENYIRNQVSDVKNSANFVAGLMLGGLAGAAAMLLFAPQAGKSTRNQIQQKFIELRDQSVSSMEDTMAKVRTSASQIKSEVTSKANNLKQQGEDVLVEQLDRVSAAAEAGKKAVQG